MNVLRSIVVLLLTGAGFGCAVQPMDDYTGPEVESYVPISLEALKSVFHESSSPTEIERLICDQRQRRVSAYQVSSAALTKHVDTGTVTAALIRCGYPAEEAVSSAVLAGADPQFVIQAAVLAGTDSAVAYRAAQVTGIPFQQISSAAAGATSAGTAAGTGYPWLDPRGMTSLIRLPFGWTPGTIELFKQASYKVQRVLFATNRRPTGSSDPYDMYGADRAEISYGRCDVSVPANHVTGRLENPEFFWFLRLNLDPSQYFVLLDGEQMTRDAFLQEIRDRTKGSPFRDVLLFVHGYNVTFEDAALRTAQLAYDLQFQGPAIFFSWPSKGAVIDYPRDRQAAEWSQHDVMAVLRSILSNSDDQKVFVIAHSMGGYAFSGALRSLAYEDPSIARRVTEIILAAPDIDADVFKRDIVPAIAKVGRPVTLYASSNDAALRASREFNGAPRAGDSGAGLVLAKGVETVDATAVDTSLLGHSYFSSVRTVLNDIVSILRTQLRANFRSNLRAIDSPGGRHWEFIASPPRTEALPH